MKALAIAWVLGAVVFLTACGGNTNAPAMNTAAAGDEGAAKAIPALVSKDEQERLASQGAEVYSKYGCGNCHSRTDERQGLSGPPLGKTAQRHLTRNKDDELATRRWFYSHIRNPEAHPGVYHGEGAYAATKMPAFPQLSDDEMRALIEFLMTRR